MNCILHIGVEKTGSTSIQRFLSVNRVRLLAAGVLYPHLTGHGGHAPLCVASYESYRDDDLCRYSVVRDVAEWHGYRDLVRDVLRVELEHAAGEGASTVVISSEHIQSRLRSLEELRNLRSILHEAGVSSITVLVYLRDPVEIVGSLYSTAVKFGSGSLVAPGPEDGYYRNVCDHRGTLGRFAEVFGDDAMLPRLFVKSGFPHGSVVRDFCGVLGIPSEEYEITGDASNRALSAAGIGILARLNDAVPVFVDGRYNPRRQLLIDLLESRYYDPPYVPSAEIIAAYDSVFRDSNEWVRARYFPEIRVLFPESANVAEKHPDEPAAKELDALAARVLEEIRAVE